ncbi:conserved protein of unknown function [Pseudomonas marincola]|uniref:Uncharacterized protein n=1 Tax=Pseudomonas marincola TaxID=437900 RepID=A0A653DXJ9_9PSED|nr:conserved protein of unknown function [Pseudomonas marincola]
MPHCVFVAGGWNPHRGFRHGGLTDSLDGIGASAIARRIALLRRYPSSGLLFLCIALAHSSCA